MAFRSFAFMIATQRTFLLRLVFNSDVTTHGRNSFLNKIQFLPKIWSQCRRVAQGISLFLSHPT